MQLFTERMFESSDLSQLILNVTAFLKRFCKSKLRFMLRDITKQVFVFSFSVLHIKVQRMSIDHDRLFISDYVNEIIHRSRGVCNLDGGYGERTSFRCYFFTGGWVFRDMVITNSFNIQL